eukprot:TRINITY_DN11260_c0_g1_i1.p1 TRINITY_DN11260_c0_g1~~TRINITY_DN11260_c0_g1_i1.p1  ORF type:complete len:391 (-),score=78.55 TRINITY_DN11260_c0_g1_i1:163-1335(-)
MYGWRHSFVHKGWLNLLDAASMIALFLVYVFDIMYLGSIPVIDVSNLRGDTWYTFSSIQAHWQSMLGLACFCTIFKGLKFSTNVPAMAYIGETFSRSVVGASLFLVVVMVMITSFATLFNLIFIVTTEDSFDSLQLAMFSLFRGLVGDIDTTGMFASKPIYAPVFFTLYITVVLFVAFTILISIVGESFSSAKGFQPKEGFFVDLQKWRLGEGTEEYSLDCQKPAPIAGTHLEAVFRAELREHKQQMDRIERLLLARPGFQEGAGSSDATNPLQKAGLRPDDPEPEAIGPGDITVSLSTLGPDGDQGADVDFQLPSPSFPLPSPSQQETDNHRRSRRASADDVTSQLRPERNVYSPTPSGRRKLDLEAAQRRIASGHLTPLNRQDHEDGP